MSGPFPLGDKELDIFNAALTGFISNKDFHGPISQGSPMAAVEFANSVVLAAIANPAERDNVTP